MRWAVITSFGSSLSSAWWTICMRPAAFRRGGVSPLPTRHSSPDVDAKNRQDDRDYDQGDGHRADADGARPGEELEDRAVGVLAHQLAVARQRDHEHQENGQ